MIKNDPKWSENAINNTSFVQIGCHWARLYNSQFLWELYGTSCFWAPIIIRITKQILNWPSGSDLLYKNSRRLSGYELIYVSLMKKYHASYFSALLVWRCLAHYNQNSVATKIEIGSSKETIVKQKLCINLNCEISKPWWTWNQLKFHSAMSTKGWDGPARISCLSNEGTK